MCIEEGPRARLRAAMTMGLSRKGSYLSILVPGTGTGTAAWSLMYTPARRVRLPLNTVGLRRGATDSAAWRTAMKSHQLLI